MCTHRTFYGDVQLSLWWAEAHVYKERNWTPPQWRVGVYGSTAVAGGMVFPKIGGSTATLVGRVCALLIISRIFPFVDELSNIMTKGSSLPRIGGREYELYAP